MLLPPPDTPGLWPLLRRDERLSGHQPLPGAIARPVVSWRYFLGGPLFDARLIPSERGADLLLPFGGCLHRFDAGGALLWKSAPFGIESIVGVEDIDADGALEIVASNGKSVFVLDASSGLVLWQEYLGPPFAGGFMHTGARLHRFAGFGGGMQLAIGLLSSKEVVLYDFTSGAARPERRHILWMDDFFHPTILAADLDGDGRDELVVTKLGAVYAFDPLSGAMRSECHWSSGGTAKRNYGLLEAVDIDGDGALELVVISDRVSRHIAVVDNDGSGRLTNRWDLFVEHIYDSDETELRFATTSVLDFDGDGRYEVVVSIFNESGDGRWTLEVIDAVTGDVRERLADAYLRGVECGVPDTPPYLLVSFEHTRVPRERGRIVMLEWRDGGLVEHWSHEHAAFVGRFAETVQHRALFRTDLPPADDVWVAWVDGEPYVPLLCDEGLALVALRDQAQRMRVIPQTGGIVGILAVGDLDGDTHDELVVSDAHGGISFIQLDGTVIGSLRAGMRLRPGAGPYYMAKPMSTPVVSADAEGRYCAAPDAGAEAHILRWSPERSMPELVARTRLRGRIGPEEAYHALSWYRDHNSATLLGSLVGDGPAELVAVGADGHVRHHWRVSSLPGSPPTSAARTGIHDYALLTLDRGPLLVVSGFRSPSMNSESTVALDRDGGERWSLSAITMPGHVLGPGPWSAMSVETVGASTRLHFLAKDTLVAIDAATGEPALAPLQLRPFNAADMRARMLSMDDFSAYGAVIPLEIDRERLRLLIANYGGHGLIDDTGSARWWHSAPLSSLTGSFGGLADIDGDGRPELGVSDATGDFICLDALSGVERWRLHLGAVATGIATCDIDGDGRSEYIIATREGALLAIGAASNGVGFLKWRLDLGYTLGAPAIADFDGDGSSEILVVSGDGYLYSITGGSGGVS